MSERTTIADKQPSPIDLKLAHALDMTRRRLTLEQARLIFEAMRKKPSTGDKQHE